MKERIFLILIVFVLTFVGTKIFGGDDHDDKKEVLTENAPGLIVKDIIKDHLEFVEDVEIVVSHLTIPPNMQLPKHWHPGEEFQYYLKGSGVLWQEGKPDIHLKKGDIFHLPFKQVHSARSLEDGATVLVFRVHQKGEPVSIKIE